MKLELFTQNFSCPYVLKLLHCNANVYEDMVSRDDCPNEIILLDLSGYAL